MLRTIHMDYIQNRLNHLGYVGIEAEVLAYVETAEYRESLLRAKIEELEARVSDLMDQVEELEEACEE